MTALPRRAILIGSLLLLCGCGGGDGRPKLATVHGKVTLKGKPVPLAKVTFIPVGGGQSSEGETSPSGDYELFFRYEEPGAQIGKHKVTISTFIPKSVDDQGKPEGGRAEIVPTQYNTNTTLEKEVAAGENEINFELQ
jgi:hypothetical protein